MSLSSSNSPRAFISVYDKSGLAPLAKALVDVYGYELISTGGTRKFLEEQGIPSIESSEITGFGELIGGRVKSLHPEIFAGILAKRDDASHTVPFYIETVIVNLYPFEAALADTTLANDEAKMVEYIDIGGSSLIRAAAKNYASVNVLCDATQYDSFLQELKLGDGKTSVPFRKKLASDAFTHSADYDGHIQRYFLGQSANPNCSTASAETSMGTSEATLDTHMTLNLNKIRDMRYGENPHQKAALYRLTQPGQPAETGEGFELLNGKPLSFNNIVDMESAWAIATEFTSEPACAVIKHNNPCGVALGHTIDDAYHTAFFADSLSAFGGVVAFNGMVNVAAAEQMKDVFLEVIVAPGYEPAALELLQTKKNLRVIQRPLPVQDDEQAKTPNFLFKQASDDLFLVQADDPAQTTGIDQLLHEGTLGVVTETRPDPSQMEDMVFAWKVCKHVKSNAIVLAKGKRTVGIGVGQTSRIGALEIALRQACDEAKGAVMASDGFLPAVDNVEAVVQARVAAIIQPGGSIKDKDVIAVANQHQLPMVTTGVREFRH